MYMILWFHCILVNHTEEILKGYSYIWAWYFGKKAVIRSQTSTFNEIRFWEISVFVNRDIVYNTLNMTIYIWLPRILEMENINVSGVAPKIDLLGSRFHALKFILIKCIYIVSDDTLNEIPITWNLFYITTSHWSVSHPKSIIWFYWIIWIFYAVNDIQFILWLI